MNEELVSRLVTAGLVAVIAIVVWLLGRSVKKRLPERWRELVDQLMPVLISAIVVVGLLVVIDPDQASRLLESLIQSVPRIMVAIILVIIARALGRIAGLFVEAGLRRASPVLAVRGRIITSAFITAIGVVMAMQQLGVSADIILILVAALAFGFAIAAALSVGLGSVPLARHVAAGRHVSARYEPGDLVRVGDVEGKLTEIGLVSTRIEIAESKSMDVPNVEFIERVVAVRH